jgi:hypothetical protein
MFQLLVVVSKVHNSFYDVIAVLVCAQRANSRQFLNIHNQKVGFMDGCVVYS